MESLILSLETIMPIFLMMLLGYFLKTIKFLKKSTLDEVNKMIFKVFLPLLLFNNIYSTDSAQVFDGKLVVFVVVAVMLIFFVGLAAVFVITKENTRRGVLLQSFFRTNFAILGVPIVNYLCEGSSGGVVALMVAIVIPIFNALAVISLEIFGSKTINIKKIIMGIIKNPLIIGCVIGLLCKYSGVILPEVIEKSVTDISKIASPLAIIVLGAGFSFSGIKGYVKENIIMVISRLIIIPAIVLSVAAYIGFTGEAFACLMVLFGGPVAVSSYSMAQQMGADENLTSQIIVLTSAFCIFTFFVWIYVFSSFGII